MKNKKRRTKVGIMVIGIAFLLTIISASCTGCKLYTLAWGNENIEPEVATTTKITTTATPTTTVVTTTAPLPPKYTNPLTGEKSSEQISKQRPFAVCIGNTAAAMPQFGIANADILVEAPVEGGITRLMIISCSISPNAVVGSVRSTRTYLSDIAKDFDALQAYAGTSDVGSSMHLAGCDTLDYIMQNLSEAYYRDPLRSSPHHIMTTGEKLFNSAVSLGYRTSFSEQGSNYPFSFVDYFEKAVMPDTQSKYVKIPFSSVQTAEFKYDEESSMYTRYQFSSVHTDAENNEPLTYKNLILLFCDAVTYDKSTGTEISLDIQSGGSGYYISDGKYMDIIWHRDESSNLKLCDKSGKALEINRGKTYIGLVKVSTKNSVVLN